MGAALPKHSEEETLMFPDMNEPDSYRVARNSAGFLSIPLLLFNFVALFLVLKKILKERNDQRVPRRRKLQWFIVGQLMASSVLNILQLIVAPGEGFSWQVCTYLGAVFAPLYILSNAFVYLCLLERAESVDVNRSSRAPFRSLLFTIARIGVYFVPFLAVFSFFLFQGKLYFREQNCVQSVVSWIAWLSLALDTSLSLLLLYLFVEPVRFYLRVLKASGHDAELSRKQTVLRLLTRRNFIYSLVAIFSTIVYLVGVCSSTEILSRAETPSISWMRHVQSNGIVLELFLNSSMVLLMGADTWMPESWQHLTRRLDVCCTCCFPSMLTPAQGPMPQDSEMEFYYQSSLAVVPPTTISTAQVTDA